MLTDQTCEELAEILIGFVETAPGSLVNRNIKKQVGASHSLITANIRNSRAEVEEALKRFHFWLEQKSIGISTP